MSDYSSLSLVADNYFLVETGRCRYCSSGCDDCQGTGWGEPHEADLSNLLYNIALAGALTAAARDGHAKLEHDLRNAQQRCIALEHASETLAAENAEAKGAILRQAARLAALESELATLQAKVVAAMSSAGPEGAEDERAT